MTAQAARCAGAQESLSQPLSTPQLEHQLALRLGDNCLILGHRLSEWCGKAPYLEEDIALANAALDLLGHCQLWLELAAEREGQGRSADDLAMLRDAWDFRNLLLVEQPNGDFGQTLVRQYLFDQWHLLMLQALTESRAPAIAEIAQKAVREVAYHRERSADLVVRLGDGSAESHQRLQAALDKLWPFVGELCQPDATDAALAAAGIAPALDDLRPTYEAALAQVFAAATLRLPDSRFAHQGGKSGQRHSEHLGLLLSEMQWLQRAYPGAHW